MPHAYNNLGIVFKAKGETERSLENYQKAVRLKPDFCEAHKNLVDLHRYDGSEAHILQLKDLRKKISAESREQIYLNFALGKIYDDMKEHELAFGYFKEANRLHKNFSNYTIRIDEERFSKIQRKLEELDDCSLIKELELPPVERIPVFILGMPRSGTTLVEQILSGHSEIFAAGELPHLESSMKRADLLADETVTSVKLERLRECYLSMLSTTKSPKRYITDKMPQNFLYIGWICAALLEAKIVHVRRDPMAVCWSIYRTLFANGHNYGSDLKDLAAYYQLYSQLMDIWSTKYPEQIFEVDYDRLVINPEAHITELLQFLGLFFEESCLRVEQHRGAVKTASALQVRQKIYQGSSRNLESYRSFLRELEEGLC